MLLSEQILKCFSYAFFFVPSFITFNKLFYFVNKENYDLKP